MPEDVNLNCFLGQLWKRGRSARAVPLTRPARHLFSVHLFLTVHSLALYVPSTLLGLWGKEGNLRQAFLLTEALSWARTSQAGD